MRRYNTIMGILGGLLLLGCVPSIHPIFKPQDVVFDKAEEAESLDKLRYDRNTVIARIKEVEDALEQTKELPQRERLETELEDLKFREQRMSKIIISAEK